MNGIFGQSKSPQGINNMAELRLIDFLQKPSKKTIEYLDYHECQTYIEAKYDIEVRDYDGALKYNPDGTRVNPEAEYKDFWHWVIDRYSIHNGCFFTMDIDLLNDSNPYWVQEILKMFFDEFGDEIDFFVEW